MSSRDNLKQLMKKQQLLFDALESKPAFGDRSNRMDQKKNDSSGVMSKILNSSNHSYQPNDCSNLQGSFRIKSPDMSAERLNNSTKSNQDFMKSGSDFVKKCPSSKMNQDLYNQLMKNKYQPQNDVARVQKFINDIFSNDKSATKGSPYNSPFKGDQRQRQCVSPMRSPDESGEIRKQQLNPELIRNRQSPYNNNIQQKTSQVVLKDKKQPQQPLCKQLIQIIKQEKFSEPPRSPTPKNANAINPILNNFLGPKSSLKIQHQFAADLRGRPSNFSPEQDERRMSPTPIDPYDVKQRKTPNNIDSHPTSLKNIYNHIHSKIDNRMRTNNTDNVSPHNRLPPMDAPPKNMKQRLLEDYLSSHTQQDQLRKRIANQTNTQMPQKVPLKAEPDALRPKTEGNVKKEAPQKRTDSYQQKNTAQESSLSTTYIHESKTDEKSSKGDLGDQKDSQDGYPKKPPQNLQRLLNEIQVQKIIEQEEFVYTVLAVLSNQKKALKLCKCYLNLIQEVNIDSMQYIINERESQKIIVKCILLERIGLLVVLYETRQAEEEFDENNLKNLLLYIHNNQILMLESINEKIDSQEKKKIIESRLKHLQNNKKIPKLKSQQDRINLMKKNNNIISSILTLIIENPNREGLQDLDRLVKGSDQLSLQQGTLIILDCFQKILTNLQQLRLSHETHLTDQTFEDDQDQDVLQQQDQPQAPFLPPASEKEYTLVLDLDETLVHYQELHDGGQFLVRPYAEQFLFELSRYYEIVIFTAAIKEYADFILDVLDTNRYISYRIYRQHTSQGKEPNTSFKDLSKLGRDLSKCLIVDNLPENFSQQPENGIYIQTWMGETEDRALYDLAPLLKLIVKKKVPDVRIALRKFRDSMLDNILKGVSDPHLNLTLE